MSMEYGLIFQETAIRRMTYVGSPLVFDIRPFDVTNPARDFVFWWLVYWRTVFDLALKRMEKP